MANFTTWTIFLILFSTFFVSKIADGNEQNSAQLTEASHNQATGWDGNQERSDHETSTGSTDEAVTEGQGPSTAETAAPSPPTSDSSSSQACDVNSISSTLTEKIETLEKKVESLVSQLTENLESKFKELNDAARTTNSAAVDSGSEKSANVQENFSALLESLKLGNISEAMIQWDIIEKPLLGPTAKTTILRDILFLSYDSKSSVIKFSEELINSKDKKFLPSVFDVLMEATKLNSENIFNLALAIKNELGLESSLFKKLPDPVRHITSGKLVKLTYNCKTLQKKLAMHVKEDNEAWKREYWPVVASHAYGLNHTRGGMWTFESTSSGNFYLKNFWYGDYLWTEPNYQNLRTVEEESKFRNGTEFKVSLNVDSTTVNINSVFYKDSTIVEGYISRNTRDQSKPLRVDQDQNGIKFTVELIPENR